MASGHHDGPSPGKIALFVVLIVVIVLALFSTQDTQFEILEGFRSTLANLFDKDWFFVLRTVSGIIVVGLTAFSVWLLLRILEMENDHKHHVYPHEVHKESHKHHKEHTQPQIPVHKKEEPVVATNTEEIPSHLVDSKIEKSATDALVSHQVKTAPPPQAILREVQENTQSTNEPTYKPQVLNLPKQRIGESSVRGLDVGQEKPGHFQWQTVLRYISSPNSSDWKIAIIQADTILDEMTYMAGIEGETVGERLQNADPGLFKTLSYAREAHGVRNKIAHGGFDFNLNDRDARRAIKLYEEVFKEFKYI